MNEVKPLDGSIPLHRSAREKFCQEVASGKSQTAAYKLAFPRSLTWKEGTAASRASDLAKKPDVRARLEFLRGAVLDAFVLTTAQAKEAVLLDAWEVLHGDTSDLITHRRLNCRHCHGIGHAYRWRDEPEFWQALGQASEAQQKWEETPPERRHGKRPELPTDDGGYGFKRLAPPMPDCPKCEGEGIEDVRVADIRTLSGPSRRLYAGVKVKKDGSIEVLTRSKESARDLLGRYAGVVVDKLQHSGALGVFPMQLPDAVKSEILKAIEKDI